ncbi:hypothetical protein E0Y62_00095 [Cytobacillus praedii]|uniref:Magnesium chelatase ChlI-like catalytic domain-containing protein n=1 Tax=Cytobacillus praedii TaxID=1742358 RepID=A0A4R1B5P6_9BACI|nr:hypothetical protein E0Y62_00095 [Cytobacillus praedii]
MRNDSKLLKDKNSLITNRSFRSPHPNVSTNALICGGTYAVPV